MYGLNDIVVSKLGFTEAIEFVDDIVNFTIDINEDRLSYDPTFLPIAQKIMFGFHYCGIDREKTYGEVYELMCNFDFSELENATITLVDEDENEIAVEFAYRQLEDLLDSAEKKINYIVSMYHDNSITTSTEKLMDKLDEFISMMVDELVPYKSLMKNMDAFIEKYSETLGQIDEDKLKEIMNKIDNGKLDDLVISEARKFEKPIEELAVDYSSVEDSEPITK